VVFPAAIGLTLGALFVYSVAYLGGKPLVVRWGKIFGITWQKLEAAEAQFIAGGADEIIVFGLRAVPITPNFLISSVCGLVRYPVKEFILLTFLGSVTRAILMGFLGWSVGAAYIQYAESIAALTRLIAATIGVVVLGTGIVIFLRKKLRRKNQ
jgi:membrane protein DedA with SNARE-associated domain